MSFAKRRDHCLARPLLVGGTAGDAHAQFDEEALVAREPVLDRSPQRPWQLRERARLVPSNRRLFHGRDRFFARQRDRFGGPRLAWGAGSPAAVRARDAAEQRVACSPDPSAIDSTQLARDQAHAIGGDPPQLADERGLVGDAGLRNVAASVVEEEPSERSLRALASTCRRRPRPRARRQAEHHLHAVGGRGHGGACGDVPRATVCRSLVKTVERRCYGRSPARRRAPACSSQSSDDTRWCDSIATGLDGNSVDHLTSGGGLICPLARDGRGVITGAGLSDGTKPPHLRLTVRPRPRRATPRSAPASSSRPPRGADRW